MSNDQSVDDQATYQVAHELPVKILVDLSSFNAAIQNNLDGFAHGLNEPLVKERRKFLIDLTFRNKLTEHMSSWAHIDNHQ